LELGKPVTEPQLKSRPEFETAKNTAEISHSANNVAKVVGVTCSKEIII